MNDEECPCCGEPCALTTWESNHASIVGDFDGVDKVCVVAYDDGGGHIDTKIILHGDEEELPNDEDFWQSEIGEIPL